MTREEINENGVCKVQKSVKEEIFRVMKKHKNEKTK